ncbi:hypothetical protein MRB53_009007 [Persea americana]|uniref:Uncharacterized protein n=1 Tax=Persea americana TaxID=3435 RepID=A0ACC2LMR2_PERAE|nr:hypothetical protein MRB53_009007 [Persea americana]
MLKLAERMVTSSCTGVRASTAHSWTSVSGNDSKDVRVMMKRSSDDPGRPSGIILSASTSVWLPHPHKRVFDYLRNENSRNKSSDSNNNTNMLLLQECRTDPTGSFLIFAPVDNTSMNMVLAGGDPDNVPILPSGFSLFPDGDSRSLLTVAFQILVGSVPTATLPPASVMTVNSVVSATVEKMKALITENV